MESKSKKKQTSDWLQIFKVRKFYCLICGWFDAFEHLPCWMRVHELHMQIHKSSICNRDNFNTYS